MPALDDILAAQKIVFPHELLAAGVTRRQIQAAIAAGTLMQPDLGDGPEPRVYIAQDAQFDPDIEAALATKLSDGVVFGLAAAQRHQLISDFAGTLEVLAPYTKRVRTRSWLNVRRTRDAANLTIGIQDWPNDLGVTIRITNPARTVLDLLRMKSGSGESWRFGVEALKAYMGRGGSTLELKTMADQFEQSLPEKVELLMEGLQEAIGAPTP